MSDPGLDATGSTFTAEEARRLTDRLRVTLEGTWELVTDAFLGRIWIPLGYATWDDYVARELGATRLRLPRETRDEVIGSLSAAGLSSRSIAAVTGVTAMTVSRSLAASGVTNVTPDESNDEPETDAPEADVPETDDDVPSFLDDAVSATEPEPRVTGLDGKSYPKAKPAKPEKPKARQRFNINRIVEQSVLSADNNINSLKSIVESYDGLVVKDWWAPMLANALKDFRALLREIESRDHG